MLQKDMRTPSFLSKTTTPSQTSFFLIPVVICTDLLLITFHPLEFPEVIEEDNKGKVLPLQGKKGVKHTKARTVPYICKVPNTSPPQEGQRIV